jgi:hypothetical protein
MASPPQSATYILPAPSTLASSGPPQALLLATVLITCDASGRAAAVARAKPIPIARPLNGILSPSDKYAIRRKFRQDFGRDYDP